MEEIRKLLTEVMNSRTYHLKNGDWVTTITEETTALLYRALDIAEGVVK